jgi:hypothetical protein
MADAVGAMEIVAAALTGAANEIEVTIPDNTERIVISTNDTAAFMLVESGGTAFPLVSGAPIVLTGRDYGGRTIIFKGTNAKVVGLACELAKTTD